MNILIFAILATALSAKAFIKEPAPYKNTIFGDERLKGEPFEFLTETSDNIPPAYDYSNNPYRLPTTTRPTHYEVLWTVNIADLSFSGEVAIDLHATEANVNEIVLHAHDLEISSLELYRQDTVIFQTNTSQPEYHFLRVRLNTGFLEYNADEPVIYTLKISFEAPLRTDMTGLYRNWFRNDPEDEVSWMASTHFQATAARFAFPCYDEPGFKATFDVTIRRPEGFGSWFCTRRISNDTVVVPNYVDDIYSRTPIMSTYLLALIVAEYESIIVEENSNLMYEVIARPAAINDQQYEYALNLGQLLLARMSDHTALDFYGLHPNLKMTQAAIPDFRAGAMENWGLLVYREAYIMYSEEHTNSNSKQLIAYILSHEIAHMWFGNLVTCDWWDNFWLNEGFARYYQYFLTDWVDSSLGFATRFIPEQVHTSLLADSVNNPHPLTNPGLGTPVEIRTMFSTISYNKGASVIRMTEHLMGFENHRTGLRNYLSNRQFSTADSIHLFQALQDAAVESGAISGYPNFNIIEYYRTWTEQAGHPVLFVDVNHETGLMTINQRRFNINSGFATANTNWIIPITFATASNPDFNNTKPTHIIRASVTVIDRESVGDEWVIFNNQQTGFYRVYYDDYTWDLITLLLRSPDRTLVHEYNKAQIVNDVFQFARSGLMPYTKALNILSFMREETDYAPWIAAITGFNWINNRLIGSPLENQFNAMFIDWATPLMTQLGFEPNDEEEFMDSYLRYQLAPVMCRLGYEPCLNAARTQFDDLKNGISEVPVDSRQWVYCNALRQGNYEDYEFLWERFLNHHVYSEKILLLGVLGCTPDEDALNEFLDAIVEENTVIRHQDYTTAFNSAVTGNEGNTQIVFEYIKENLQNVSTALGGASEALSYISSRLRTNQEISDDWAVSAERELGTQYTAVLNGAAISADSLSWATSVQEDISNHITSGGYVPEFSTASPEPPVTNPQVITVAPLVQQVTPDLPASAVTSLLSSIVLLFALAAYFVI